MPINTQTVFNKADFLTPVKFAKKHGFTLDEVRQAAKKLMTKRATVKPGGYRAGRIPAIISGKGDRADIIHPLATEMVMETIRNARGQK